MPLYDYQCQHCGPFTAMRKMHESAQPAQCDRCGTVSKRVISAPRFALLATAQRQAHERNEQSAHAPRSIRRDSCGCSGAHRCKPGTGTTQRDSVTQQGNGFQMQTKTTARPWMLGH